MATDVTATSRQDPCPDDLRDDYAVVVPLRVRWAEVDQQGVVFNPHYFSYFDLALTEWWRALGVDYPGVLTDAGTDVFAVTATSHFRASARFDDQLEVGIRAARLGRTSLTYRLTVWRADEVVTTGELVYVHVGLPQQRPELWPAWLRERVADLERRAPET